MKHRHLAHSRYTLAAIDDIIERGSLNDWVDLREALKAKKVSCEKILKVCKPKVLDPYQQRYHFWKLYVERLLS